MQYLGVDSESYGNKYMFAGVPNSVALLLLIWIYFYTLDHADDEKKLASALAEFAVRTVTNIDVPAEETPNIARESIPDSEF